MIRVIVALLAIAAVVGAGAASGAGAQSPAATKSAATKPPIHKMLIPYPKKRKREMAAYSKRHYGQYKWRLNDPKVIVDPLRRGRQHQRDLQHLQDRPAGRRVPRAAQRLLALRRGRLGRCLQVRPADDPLPPHRRPQLDRDRGRARRLLRPGHPRPARRSSTARSSSSQWLRCRFGIPVSNVIGHNESLSSPFYKELDPRFQGQTHGDWNHADMQIYRADLTKLGAC